MLLTPGYAVAPLEVLAFVDSPFAIFILENSYELTSIVEIRADSFRVVGEARIVKGGLLRFFETIFSELKTREGEVIVVDIRALSDTLRLLRILVRFLKNCLSTGIKLMS